MPDHWLTTTSFAIQRLVLAEPAVIRSLALVAALTTAAPAIAQEPGAAPVPVEISALAGCWRGDGEVMGKPVLLTLSARPITQGAFFLIETDSRAKADPADRHNAHLIFGGRAPTTSGDTITSFWADSFGGDYTSVGSGLVRPDGFEVTYPYPDAQFVNRWVRDGDHLNWTITAVSGTEQTVFSRNSLTRVDCPAT